VLRQGRDLTFEITLDADLDWDPAEVRVQWPGHRLLRGEVVPERTTAPGRVAAGLVVRLGLRLAADGPAGPPVWVALVSGGARLLVGVAGA
jgi:hypothetical protein